MVKHEIGLFLITRCVMGVFINLHLLFIKGNLFAFSYPKRWTQTNNIEYIFALHQNAYNNSLIIQIIPNTLLFGFTLKPSFGGGCFFNQFCTFFKCQTARFCSFRDFGVLFTICYICTKAAIEYLNRTAFE